MATMWILWAACAFAGAALVFWIWTQVRRRRKFAANREEIHRIAGHYGISLDDAFELIDLPPDELADRAHRIALENR